MALPLPMDGKGSRQLSRRQPSGGAVGGAICGESRLMLLREKRDGAAPQTLEF